MDPSLQIRKLPLDVKSRLVRHLDFHESWKKLMSTIPLTLDPNDYKCDITLNNPAKYSSKHFHIIEDNATQQKTSADLLLREWGTSGRVRPALGHLKHLLVKAELFKAADYLCVEVLKEEAPPRPSQGPAARVTFHPDEFKDPEVEKVEKILDEIDYPSSAIQNIYKLNSVNTNLNYTTCEKPKTIPKIVISESPDFEEPAPSFKVPVVVQTGRDKSEKSSESDMIKFSSSSVSNSDNDANFPKLSSLFTKLSSSSQSSEDNNIPLVVENFSSSSEMSNNIPSALDSSSDSFTLSTNRPQLSSLLSSSSDDPEPHFIMPALSELSLASNPDSSSNHPALSQLIGNLDSKSGKISRSCSSPLPNLSLNTPLPHITYGELAIATNDFDETPLGEGGRFLGAGAFGKVYLAEGLFGNPVAVKKVLLENEEEVKVDDLVTRQFRNEVEILSKYKHENLVSLLGYSCDGSTYCLMYEYVPGGALKDRLQKHELIWTERLYIAMGTARAIAYLHTGYSTPLIHRDVKSANILLDFTNKPKLCDFGLIKRSLNQNTNTATSIFGTSAYMAPEAFRGDISVKLDTFSFGVVLVELLTSLPPMDENREGVDLATHIQDNSHNGITSLLDKSAGGWLANNINFGQKMYEIAMSCLREKKERPTMSAISTVLGELVQKFL